jgi:ElaB/YqjD/DUF883 family membrane-anchored ribosome-binding protein
MSTIEVESAEERVRLARERLRIDKLKLDNHVSEQVHQVTSTVQHVKDTVTGTVDSAKMKVNSLLNSADGLPSGISDVTTFVRERPWASIGLAMASGFLFARRVAPVTPSIATNAWGHIKQEINRLTEVAIQEFSQSVEENIHQIRQATKA